MYADYVFYVNRYLLGRDAAISAADFPFFERKAGQEINRQTFGRVEENCTCMELVKMCCCELAEYFYWQEQEEQKSPGIKSERVDDYSVTYEDAKERHAKQGVEIHRILRFWMSNTGLLYRGR